MLGLIGGALSGIGSAAGSAIAAHAQLQATRETNEQNYKIWGEQQAFNKDMYQRQLADNRENWRMQNEYNDPMAQRQRLADAGFNPALMMNGGNSAGVASSAPNGASFQSPSAPTMQAPDLSPYANAISQAFATAGNIFTAIESNSQNEKRTNADVSKTTEETKNIALQNKLMPKSMSADINLKNAQSKLAIGNYTNISLQNKLDNATLKDRIQQQSYETNYRGALLASQQLSNEQQSILLKYLEPNQVVQLLMADQNLKNAVKAGALSDEERKESIMRQLNINADTNLKKTQTYLNEDEYNRMRPAQYDNLASQTNSNNANAQVKRDQHKVLAETADIVITATNEANKMSAEFNELNRWQMREVRRSFSPTGAHSSLVKFGLYGDKQSVEHP